MKPGLKLALSFKALGIAASKVSERLRETGHCVSNQSLYETIAEQENRTKCAKLARVMSVQKNEKIKLELWKLFIAA